MFGHTLSGPESECKELLLLELGGGLLIVKKQRLQIVDVVEAAPGAEVEKVVAVCIPFPMLTPKNCQERLRTGRERCT